MLDKKELRAAVRARKRAMTSDEIRVKSELLAEKCMQTEQYRNASTIYAYLPYNQEVLTTILLEKALSDGKRVAVPKVYGDDMKFLYITDFENLAKSDFGIPEPIADEPVADDTLALVIMPGLAFDPQGHRVGYGGGFYDKFLSREPNHPTVALCYDFQMYPVLETEAHDIPVDLVLWA